MTSRTVTLFALVAVPTILCLGNPAGAAPLQTDAERLCAHYPQGAWFAAADPTTLPTDPSGNDDCPDLCEKWVALCKNIVKVRTQCWTKAGSQVERLRKAECNSLTDESARAQCVDVLKAEKDALKTYLDVTSGWGVTSCKQEGWGACTAHCD